MEAGSSAWSAQQAAMGAIYRSIQQQAALLAYADNFRLMGYLSLLCIPLLLLLGKVMHRADGVAEAAGE
jgi:hypothetical protein